MAHPDLTSHHVNYLIWRYLQESGHGEAAVTLQRAWNHDPQSLPFAPYIRTHALVSLVQKGLQYYELEQSLDKEGNQATFSPSDYFFGPVPLESETQKGPNEAGTGTDQAPVSPTNKVAQDGGLTNGHLTLDGPVPQITPSVKKARKADRGETNGDETPMDVDSNGIANETKLSATTVSPSLGETTLDGDGDVNMGIRPDLHDQEPTAAPTFTLITGHSVGVQITPAKATDLSPNTAILDVAGDDHVNRALWRPGDPSAIVAAGDTFCSLYKLSSSLAPVQEKLVENKGDGTCVSAVAWDPLGHKLAVATYNDMRGSITMYDVAGNAVDLLPEVPRMITGLHWAEGGSHLIVVASDTKISELAVWDDSLRPDEFPSPEVINGSIYDLCWLGRNHAYACGGKSVYECDIDSTIRISKTFTSGDPDKPWSFIRCTSAGSSAIAVAASSSSASFWIPTHDIHMNSAHHGEITTIELKPNTPEPSDTNHPLILVSSSTDDTVKIWHIDLYSKRFECVHRLSLGPSAPILASSFSPDGFALAAASKDNLLIWNSQRGGTAIASWKAPIVKKPKKEEGNSPVLNGHNGNVETGQDRPLSWDIDGKKLAFGFGNQLAIINMQR